MAHFNEGFYIKKESFEVCYCTGEVHPKDPRAREGISVRGEQLFLYETDLPNFTRLSKSELDNLCEAHFLVEKVNQRAKEQAQVAQASR